MIFIVIPVYNRKEFTRNCLVSLRRQTFKDFETIVIDDGSTDGTIEMVSEEFPEVHTIKGDGNLWWAGATNAGIDFVLKNRKPRDSDYILTLNNDLEVPVHYLHTLVENALIHKRSILGSVSLDINNTQRMDFCGVSWNEFTGRYYLKAKDYGHSYQKLINKKQVIDSDLLSGRGTLIPVSVFSEIGLYDSVNFPQYAADEDFSLRARRKGWSLLIPTSTYVQSHVKETGADVNNVQFSLKYYNHLFFSIKSPLNLKVRYRWAMKNTRLKVFYFLIDSVRIMLSFSLKAFRKILNSFF